MKPAPTFSLIASIALAVPAAAQCDPAVAAEIGTGNSHSTYGAPVLRTTSLPILGTDAEMTLDYANPNSEPAILLLGFGVFTPPFVLLDVPIHIDVVNFDSGSIPFATVPGGTVIPAPIPNDPAFCTGVPFYFQVIAADLADTGTPFSVIGSNAIQWVVGDRPELVITEIMQNPSANEPWSEWFEVYNPNSVPVDISGWTISDNNGSHTIANGTVIPAGDYFVFARTANTTWNLGVVADYDYATISLSNGSDEIELAMPNGTVVDRVAYDNGTTFPDPTNRSMTLAASAFSSTANDIGANWCEATTYYNSNNRGTPGAPNDACP